MAIRFDYLAAIPVGKDRKDKRTWTSRKRKDTRNNRVYNGIVAIDGEGYDDTNGKHCYNLLAYYDDSGASDWITNESRNPKAFFDFLLKIADKNKLTVIYSGDYDVTMMLKFMPKPFLDRLKKTHHARWGKYRFTYVRRREFIITYGKRTFHLYDVFGFFQCSFAKAIDQFQVGTSEERELIKAMKERRDDFANISMDKKIEYCLLENKLLVLIMEILVRAMQDANIKLTNWYGAGAIAAAIMKREGIKQFMSPTPEDADRAVMGAYFGGRMELALAGPIENAYGYDIRSAYPSVMRNLPCLAHLSMKHATEYDPAALAVWRVYWGVPGPAYWGPFPWRDSKGNVHYPRSGQGWYWNNEIAAAMRLYPGAIKVVEGFIFTPDCEHKPFSFIEPLYRYRNQLKNANNWAQYPIKLGLNSLYGKTAQGVGYEGKPPPYRSYIWAGLITSGTRAVILDAIRQNPEHIINIATDGILSRVPLDLDFGTELGQWESVEYEEIFGIQPGVMALTERGKQRKWKTRGFAPREIGTNDDDRERILRLFYQVGPVGFFPYTVRRFVGFTAALVRTDYRAVMGEWIEQRRQVVFMPTRRTLTFNPVKWKTVKPIARYGIPDGTGELSYPFVTKREFVLDKNELLDVEQP